MAAQEHMALARSLFELYNNRQSDPAWLDKSMAAFAADCEDIDVPSGAPLHGPQGHKRFLLFLVERFPDLRTELTQVFATEDQVVGFGDGSRDQHRFTDSAHRSASSHGALDRSAVLFCHTDQQGEDGECPHGR